MNDKHPPVTPFKGVHGQQTSVKTPALQPGYVYIVHAHTGQPVAARRGS